MKNDKTKGLNAGRDEFGLTVQQRRFADEYIASFAKDPKGQAKASAIAAGYSPRSAQGAATRLRANKKVRAYIDSRLDNTQRFVEGRIAVATADEVLEFLTCTMRGIYKEQVVAVEGRGEGNSEAVTIEKDIQPKDRIKAAQALASIHGIDKPKQVEAKVSVTIIDDVGC